MKSEARRCVTSPTRVRTSAASISRRQSAPAEMYGSAQTCSRTFARTALRAVVIDRAMLDSCDCMRQTPKSRGRQTTSGATYCFKPLESLFCGLILLYADLATALPGRIPRHIATFGYPVARDSWAERRHACPRCATSWRGPRRAYAANRRNPTSVH